MSVSLLTLVQRLAYTLDDMKPHVVSAATTTTVQIAALINQTTGASTSTHDGDWVYSGNQQMRVRTGGYAPSTGTLTIFPGWTSAPVPGAALSITNLFPIGPSGTEGEDTPYQVLIQQALKKLSYPDVLTLPIVASDSYSLSAYQSWLDRQERLMGIREPAPINGRRAVDASWRNPRIERRGAVVYLVLDAPFGAGVSGNLTLDVMRPAHSLVNAAESTTGPINDESTVEANPDDVLEVAKMEAFEALMHRQASSPDGADWAAKYEAQLALCQQLAAYDRTRMAPSREAVA